ncbi:MAG: 5-amino-6-(5-phospho-D-ribitylamino)uracil phosphatase YigB [Wigglesworthia glossinidia]|nr:5-amino-6-(5-phospho-D-ribitylamino)uracil phosphatase YigB [Wigglesworthia glossinidia]
MIYFYRLIQKFRALTFDLDDTLYDNKPIISRTEKKLINFLNHSNKKLLNFKHKNYKFYRKQLLIKYPKIYYNINFWRKQSILLSITSFGINYKLAVIITKKAMKLVNLWRNQIYIESDIHRILELLSKKWPLIAITNGDANIYKCKISQYFSCIFRSGIDGPPKPYKKMYDLAAKKLKLPPKEILHVGDCLETDVFGAINYGMQSCWLNTHNTKLLSSINARTIPHFEISKLKYLKKFI